MRERAGWFLHMTSTLPDSGSADTLDEAKAALAEVYGRRT
jgi:hypothetical protein